MPEMPETLRQRAERVYRYEMTAHTKARLMADPATARTVGRLSPEDRMQIAWKMAEATRIALFDLAEQIDVLRGGQIKPE